MPGHSEFETKELQKTIHEIHEEREERHEEEKRSSWTKYIGLSTAILAVIAAVGALRSSYFVNEALINQVKAGDSWMQYQAAREKDHLYSLMLNQLLDANASNAAVLSHLTAPAPKASENLDALKPGSPKAAPSFKPKAAADRAAEYLAKVYDERAKEDQRSEKAKELEKESEGQIHRHHRFEYSVGLIQVAIALGAIAALLKAKLSGSSASLLAPSELFCSSMAFSASSSPGGRGC
jgi:hypothetical protein